MCRLRCFKKRAALKGNREQRVVFLARVGIAAIQFLLKNDKALPWARQGSWSHHLNESLEVKTKVPSDLEVGTASVPTVTEAVDQT